MASDSTSSNGGDSYESIDPFTTSLLGNTSAVASMRAENGTSVKKCRLLSLPAEIRNRIWSYALKGDDGVIHVDHAAVWNDIEVAYRLNFTITCKQIQQETGLMFLPRNTFLFQLKDRHDTYAAVENLANWLYGLDEQQCQLIGRVVVCSKHTKQMVEWLWKQAEYCNMTSGFVIGERIDKVLSSTTNYLGHVISQYESWGLEDGHHCEQAHYEVVYQ